MLGTTAARLEEIEPLKLATQLLSAEFDGDAKGLSVALGRPEEEVLDWINGDEIMDEDAVMKIRALAQERLDDLQADYNAIDVEDEGEDEPGGEDLDFGDEDDFSRI